MNRAILWLVLPAALAMVIAGQWKDIERYFKIKQISWGEGHPDNVPARGRIAYPQADSPSGDMRRG